MQPGPQVPPIIAPIAPILPIVGPIAPLIGFIGPIAPFIGPIAPIIGPIAQGAGAGAAAGAGVVQNQPVLPPINQPVLPPITLPLPALKPERVQNQQGLYLYQAKAPTGFQNQLALNINPNQPAQVQQLVQVHQFQLQLQQAQMQLQQAQMQQLQFQMQQHPMQQHPMQQQPMQIQPILVQLALNYLPEDPGNVRENIQGQQYQQGILTGTKYAGNAPFQQIQFVRGIAGTDVRVGFQTNTNRNLRSIVIDQHVGLYVGLNAPILNLAIRAVLLNTMPGQGNHYYMHDQDRTSHDIVLFTNFWKLRDNRFNHFLWIENQRADPQSVDLYPRFFTPDGVDDFTENASMHIGGVIGSKLFQEIASKFGIPGDQMWTLFPRDLKIERIRQVADLWKECRFTLQELIRRNEPLTPNDYEDLRTQVILYASWCRKADDMTL